jgi:three-Cys-motif partner protein
MTISFFKEAKEQSEIKAKIVADYFGAWSKIMVKQAQTYGTNRIAYLDLFAGPGRYEDGTQSTPLLILEQAIKDPQLNQSLVTIFNDKDANNTQTLQNEIYKLQGIQNLKYQPAIWNNEIGSDIVTKFEDMRLVPTFFFIDPFGYKGLSLRLINSVLKNWGCDCVIFFNYNRINMGINNESVKPHMEALFGENIVNNMRNEMDALSAQEREIYVIEKLASSLKNINPENKYILPFRFKNAQGTRTSHHLIFVSKHPLGYKIMKGIMYNHSSKYEQGVASFEYNQADQKFPLLFSLNQPLSDLQRQLCQKFKKQTLTMNQIFEQHHVDTPFIEKNYKAALTQLEQNGKIIANPPMNERPKRNGEITFSNKVQVTFK